MNYELFINEQRTMNNKHFSNEPNPVLSEAEWISQITHLINEQRTMNNEHCTNEPNFKFCGFAFLVFAYNMDCLNRKGPNMKKWNLPALIALLTAAIFITGCVERRLTINTNPQGAVIALNDEEIGTSPATVSFNWYGDYNIRASKEGYETLKTHRMLKGPWYDKFPFDFFAQIVNPKRIVDSYEWTFDLSERKQIPREQLIEKATQLKTKVLIQ